MQVPQNQNLHSQSFNSKFIEFVWRFPIEDGKHNQIIFTSYKDGRTRLEENIIEDVNELIESGYSTSGIISTRNITMQELTSLKDDVVKYLNEP